MELTNKRMYRAIVEKDMSFEGLFFTCVKTTGIFCRPVCTAKKPKPENIEFVRSIKDALEKGYRPCKRCEPLKKFKETPKFIRDLIDEIQNHPHKRITDMELRRRNLEPHTVRRWFMKHHHMTFHAFQRMIRLNTAFQKIQKGESVTATALDTGFESLSGFGDSFRSVFGFSPKSSVTQQIINVRRLETPLGIMVACATRQGLCLLGYGDTKSLESDLSDISKRLDAPVVRGENPHLTQLESELEEYFNGKRKEFSVPLAMFGTPFQKTVWELLRAIPYGEMRTYKQLASKLHAPDAVQAVTDAHVLNPIGILIPCHRVLEPDDNPIALNSPVWQKKCDENLIALDSWVWRKKWLLAFESEHS